MILRPNDVLDLRAQFHEEINRLLPEERPDLNLRIAVGVTGFQQRAYVSLVAHRSQPLTGLTVRILPVQVGGIIEEESLVLPWHVFCALCEHLDTLIPEARRDISITPNSDFTLDIAAGPDGFPLRLHCVSGLQLGFNSINKSETVGAIWEHTGPSFVLRSGAVKLLRGVFRGQQPSLDAGILQKRGCVVVGPAGCYLAFRTGAEALPSSRFFNFPRYSGWLHDGGIRVRARKESVFLETGDGGLAALCESRAVDDSRGQMNLSAASIGHWHIRQAEALISLCSSWSIASVLLSENQVLLQPEGKVGLDATTFGHYEGPQCQMAIDLNFLSRFLENGFHSFDLRHDSSGNQFLLARMRICEQSRLFEVERRKQTEEVIGIIYPLRESGGPLQVFTGEVSGRIQ